MICTFFGHRDTPEEAKQLIHNVLVDLIENNDVTDFYVGYNGRFDVMVFNKLKELSELYPIKYSVVLSCVPTSEKYPHDVTECSLLPDGIEDVPKRFAISYRNKWLIEQSQFVVTYISRSFGGACQFRNLALRKGKKVIDLYNE